MPLRQLVRDESGQDIAEYAISMTIITVGVMFAIYAIYNNLRTLWDALANALA